MAGRTLFDFIGRLWETRRSAKRARQLRRDNKQLREALESLEFEKQQAESESALEIQRLQTEIEQLTLERHTEALEYQRLQSELAVREDEIEFLGKINALNHVRIDDVMRTGADPLPGRIRLHDHEDRHAASQ